MNEIIKETMLYVKEVLAGDSTGHDWWHIERVWKNALLINSNEKADTFIIELAALLHDIADHKFHGGDVEIGPKTARVWLEKLNVDEHVILHVVDIIATLSFKGGKVITPMKTIEGMVVQDADRLDAIGAVSIGRAFAYGGFKGRPMYDPTEPIKANTINHFYEKLLLLSNLMNTETAKKLAIERHAYMEGFLNQFFAEWNGLK